MSIDSLDRAGGMSGFNRCRSDAHRERFDQMMVRWMLGSIWPLRPSRLSGLPNLAGVVCRDLFKPRDYLPDPSRALDLPDGLAGLARDLSPDVILAAYRRSLYPFSHFGPQKWWSPAQRWALNLENLRVTRIPRLRKCKYTVTFDTEFDTVIENCAALREGQFPLTWITAAVKRAYTDAFDSGHVHSVEVWNEQQQLVGGLYGVAAGASFSIESLFSTEPGASRIGLLVLSWTLRRWGYGVIDAKKTATWKEMGFKPVPREAYIAMTNASEPQSIERRWQADQQIPDILNALGKADG
ncbi:MAG: hypothetical protein WCA36_01785 [Pseudolabrys sp.]|jgi:leucyl/phenylalanyl-tRNA--protein transferase